jgi:transcriptional regulator with XRE-family HTH domain
MFRMERDWARLGRAFAQARAAAGLTQAGVAERIGVTRTPVQAIERGHVGGKPFKKVTGTMRSYARIVGWADGAIERILDGEDEPPLLEATQSPAAADTVDGLDLPIRIREELREGQILDSGVYELSPDGSDVQLIVVIKGKAGATPAEIRRYMETVRRTERRLRSISEADDTSPESNAP